MHFRQRIRIGASLGMFFHVDYGERLSVHQGNRDGFHGDIALRAEELCSGQRCSHFVASEPRGPRRMLASLQDHGADSAPRPIWVNEERANLCRVAKWVQQRILAPRPMVTPIKRLALAPTAATDNHQSGWPVHRTNAIAWAAFVLRHDTSALGDELAIDAKNGFERALDLRGRVILRLQSAHGCLDQLTQSRDIRGNGRAKINVRVLHGAREGSTKWIL